MTDEERRVRRLKIEENKKKKSHSKLVSCDSTTHSFEYTNGDSNSTTDIIVRKTTNCDIISTENCFKSQEIPEISDYIYAKAVELELSDNPGLRSLNQFYTDFNDTEFSRLIELRKSVRNAIKLPFKTITNESQKQVINAFHKNTITGEDVGKLMAIYLEQMVGKTIAFSKGLTPFNRVCENDQIALIKYGCFQVCSIRSVRYFNFEGQYWTLVVVRQLLYY